MKINNENVPGDIGSSGISKAQETNEAARGRQGRVGDGAASSTDRVQLSNLSETLRASDSESPERAARLQQLTADIAAGRYHADSTEVSKSIIKDSIGG